MFGNIHIHFCYTFGVELPYIPVQIYEATLLLSKGTYFLCRMDGIQINIHCNISDVSAILV